MKYRILIIGNDQAVIDEIFEKAGDDWELLTASERIRDIDSHIRLFRPNMLLCCYDGECTENIKNIANIQRCISEKSFITVACGTGEICDLFQWLTSSMADITFAKDKYDKSVADVIMEYLGSSDNQTEDVKKKHVLVIDDDPQMLRVVKEMLHDRYDVATAISGKVAYKFLEKKKTDIILLDFEMPDENGPQVLENIRKNEALADTPVLFLTGNTEREKIKEAMSFNPQGYLLKPIDRDSLTDSIRKIVGQ